MERIYSHVLKDHIIYQDKQDRQFKRILKGCIGLVSLIIVIVLCNGLTSFKSSYTIQKQQGGQWETSYTNLPDTTIIDTVNIDGIVNFQTTQYLRVKQQ